MHLLHGGNSKLIIVRMQHGALSMGQTRRPPTLRENRKSITMAYASTSSFTETRNGSDAVSGVFARFFAAFGRGVNAMQVARMNSVLHGMDNTQLNQIGITRSEIADYAEMLMLRDNKK